MRIVLISDTHYGIKNDNIPFLDNNKKFLDNVFFPYIDDNKIDTMIHLGDLVDRRKYINSYTKHRLRTDFLMPLSCRGIKSHFIVGNHDCFYKNKNEVNALREYVEGISDNFIIYDQEAVDVTFDGLDILLVPWKCDENQEQIIGAINESRSTVAMGHLEIQGFEMYRGSVVSHGDDRNIFSAFDLVFSGHFHHRSSDGRIFYLGSHAEFTWSDYDDPKGFHVFDTETKEITFIENPYKMFKKIWYNDSIENFDIETIDYSEYEKCILKVIVQEKINSYWFDKFIEKIEAVNPIELHIVEDHLNLNLEDAQDIINEAESTIDIMKNYISAYSPKGVDRVKVETKLVDLYHEALTME